MKTGASSKTVRVTLERIRDELVAERDRKQADVDALQRVIAMAEVDIKQLDEQEGPAQA